ncbi:hypothetical protein TNIN_245871, partial [Trichonephila inaurata madagascariensis]
CEALFYATLLVISLRIWQLLRKYLLQCVDNIALISTAVYMCIFSFVGFLVSLAPLVLGRFATRYKKFVAWICLFSFGLATIVELIVMAVTTKTISCKPFVHGMAYVNCGIFLLAFLSSLIYLDVLIVILRPSHPESLYNFMRSICN